MDTVVRSFVNSVFKHRIAASPTNQYVLDQIYVKRLPGNQSIPQREADEVNFRRTFSTCARTGANSSIPGPRLCGPSLFSPCVRVSTFRRVGIRSVHVEAPYTIVSLETAPFEPPCQAPAANVAGLG